MFRTFYETSLKMTNRSMARLSFLNTRGTRSLLNCLPSSVALKLPKAMPNPKPKEEFHGICITDHTGNPLIQPPSKQVKDVYELGKISDDYSLIITYRDRLRDVLLEDVPVQWNKRCVGFEETEDGVLAIFEDGSREFGNILVGADGINSPSKFN